MTKYMAEGMKDDHYRLIGIYIIAVAAFLLWLCSCTTTQYVPVETVRTEIEHVHDTIKQSDSVKTQTNTIIREARPEDSAMIAKLGIKLQANERLLILLRQELQETKSNKQESHSKDSVRVDSIQVPYPVERKLSKWESFCIDYGKIMAGATAASIVGIGFVLVVWIRKRRTRV